MNIIEIGKILLDYGSALSHVEKSRLAVENIVRSSIHGYEDMTAAEKDEAMAKAREYHILGDVLEELEATEGHTLADLRLALVEHPLYPWMNERPRQKGIGEKQFARLLAVIPDPLIGMTKQMPDGSGGEWCERTLDQLHSFAGFAVIEGESPRFKKGVQARWSPEARMRTVLIAKNCIRTGRDGYYRKVYVEAKQRYQGAVHHVACKNRSRLNPNGCGTQAHPEWGAVDSPLRPGHIDARARRMVCKELLADMYFESMRLRDEEDANIGILDEYLAFT